MTLRLTGARRGRYKFRLSSPLGNGMKAERDVSSNEVTDSLASISLRTERLILRNWTPEDRALAIALWTDPSVSRFIVAGGCFTTEDAVARLEREIKTCAEHGFQYWPLFEAGTGAFVGCAGLKPYRIEQRVLEFGVQLLPDFWGRGFANEAGRAIIALAFDCFDAAWLFAGHHPDNGASRAMLAKLGFRYTHDELYPPTGLEHPSYRLDRR
jgi:[ribosomal protein S5]-alanine N-acetyltransferase